ncbi:MAG: ABC transporter ATP-binding protein [Planctomycetes bacterium]|nr:ABC transporter ATP-binding protein [Planctomycetota bacterium]
MTEAAIQLQTLCVRPGRRVTLSVEALRIGRGERVGVLGPNGAGKSTLLRCLLGMQAGVRGGVEVLGRPLNARAGGLAALRRRIGYVPQMLPAGGEMPLTVREVVAIGRTGIAGMLRPLRRDDWRIVDAWIDRLALGPLAPRGFGEISGGEQRKTLIARAMVQQPELLLLDEPTANLDLGWRERIVQVIDELCRNTPLTLVLVCHELEVLPSGCGRVVVLDGGRVVADGSPADVLSADRIASLYGPGLDILRCGGRWAVVPGEGEHA